MRVLSFGGFIIQLSRSLLSTSQPAGDSRQLQTLDYTAAAAGEENVASNVASTTAAAIRDNLVQAQFGSLSGGIIVRSWSETIVPQLHLE